jgi:hypothetical protein
MPDNLSFADELAEILNISRDSAYRRIRGETILSLDEVGALCSHFKVSLDSLFYNSSQMVSFHYQALSEEGFTYEQHLQSSARYLEMVSGLPENELIYSAKDIPIFYYFNYPELAAFKMFFWMKSLLRYKRYENTVFSPDVISKEFTALGRKIWDLYTGVSCTELWSNETVNITLRQIEFYNECGFFDKPERARELCDQYASLVNDIKDYARLGLKNGRGKYSLYKNDILIANNTILFIMGDKRVSFVIHNMLDLLTTSEDYFCKRTEDHLRTLINKSALISTTSEKDRNKFFNGMAEAIKATANKL